LLHRKKLPVKTKPSTFVNRDFAPTLKSSVG